MRARPIVLLTAMAVLALPAAASAVDVAFPTLAYVKYTKSTSQVWATTTGGAPTKLAATGYGPVVSPYGDLVALSVPTKASTKLLVANVTGGSARTLLPDRVTGAPVWSPDETKLAIAVGPEIGRQTLVLVDVADGTQHKVATGYFNGASFSPDGTQLAYGRVAKSTQQGAAGDVYVATLSEMAGGAPVNITKDDRSVSPVWGPAEIAYSQLSKPTRKNDYPKANLAAIRPDGSARHTLTKIHVPYLLFGLTPTQWSADGSRLLAEYGGQDYSEAWTYDVKTKKARDLTGKDDGVIGYGISRDGGTVLAGTGGYDPQAKADVVTYTFAGKNRKTLVKNASGASWAGY